MNLTREQSIALLNDRHISVTANAGSGKTSVLVEKYIDILVKSKRNPSDSIRSIVALTFTRQAAADMKVKIIKKINMMIQSDLGKNLLKFKKLREYISSAKVSTIHSFCNSLLRDYPIEAGISPLFREMDEFESKTISSFVIETEFERLAELLINEDNDELIDENARDFDQLIRVLPINTLREYISELIKEPVNLGNINQFYSKTDTEIINFFENQFITSFFDELGKFLDDLMQIYSVDGDYKNLEKARNSLNEIKLEAKNKEKSSINSILDKLTNLRAIKDSKPFLLNKIAKDYPNMPDIAESLKEFIKKSELTFFGLNYTKEFIDTSRKFIALVNRINEKFWEEKHELSAYSFDDLLILTNNLLENNEVRDKILKDIDFLLVDEFQDTNQIQYDLISKLCPNLFTDNTGSASPKLFIVGDAKQSIYGFRSADVSVFLQAEEDIKNSNGKLFNHGKLSNNVEISGNKITLDGDETLGQVSLADTFRLLPGVALFTNYVCNRLFNKISKEIKYESLICGRNPISELYDGSSVDNINGSISFILAEKKSKSKKNGNTVEQVESNNVEDNPKTEAELVANYLNLLFVGKTEIKIINDGIERIPNYKDVAILVRRKDSINKITKHLIQHQIPYSVVSGSGFFKTQEVIDFISLLSVCLNQADDINFAGVLKSPFFGFNDSELLEISLCAGNYLFEKFLNYQPEIPESLVLLERAKSLLTEIIKLSNRFSISELIVRIIEITDYYAVINQFEAKEQIKSNIKQLINHASEFESKGYNSLSDFLERVKILSEDSNEAEAAFVTGDNVVKLMTIHASKGLEFPIVILFDTNYKAKTPNHLLKTKDMGIAFNYKTLKEEEGSYTYKSVKTLPEIIIRNSIVLKNLQEEIRLLYVAMTRAKDHLIIGGTIDVNPNNLKRTIKSGCFLDLFDDALFNHLTESTENYQYNSNLKFTQKPSLKLTQNCEIYTQNHSIFEKVVDSKVPKPSSESTDMPKQIIDSVVSAGNKFDVVSASKVSTYKSNLDVFIDRYVLGMPDFEKNHLDGTSSDETLDFEFSGAEYGSVVHRLFENVNIWLDSFVAGDESELKNFIEKTLFEMSINLNDELLIQILEECRNVVTNKRFSEYSKYFKYSEFEKSVNIPFNGSLLTGSIDMLLKSEDEKIIEVWDWKTNHITSLDDRDKLVLHYLPQIKFYLYIVSLMYPTKDNYSGRLFFTKLADTEDADVEIKMSKDDINDFENLLSKYIEEMKQM